MNILYVIPSFKNCGPNIVLYNFLKNTSEEINYFICTIDKLNNTEKINFKNLNCKIYELNLNKFSFIKTITKLNKIIKANNIEVVHSIGFRPDIYNFITKGKKKITTIQNNPFEDYSLLLGNYLGIFFSKIHVYIISKFNRVICCSNFVKNSINTKNSIVIYNGISPLNINYNFDNKGTIKLFSVSNLIKRKNLKTLINFYNLLSQEYKIELHIIGNGPELNHLKKLDLYNKVIFHGFKKNYENLFDNSSILVSTSYSEGLPTIVIQAISIGMPCILSDINPHREVYPIKEGFFNINNYKSFQKSFVDTINLTDVQIKKIKSFYLTNFTPKLNFVKTKNEYFD